MRNFLEKSFKNHENTCRIVLSFEDPLEIFLKDYKKTMKVFHISKAGIGCNSIFHALEQNIF